MLWNLEIRSIRKVDILLGMMSLLEFSFLLRSTCSLMYFDRVESKLIATEVADQKIRPLVIDLLQFPFEHRSMSLRFLLLEHFTNLMMLTKFMQVREASTAYALWQCGTIN